MTCQILKLKKKKQRDTILIPLGETHIPFHVSVVKNISKQEEGKNVSLRINFFVPGSSNAASNIQFPQGLAKEVAFIKELTIRSTNIQKINDVLKQVKDLQKKVKTGQQERRDRSDLADQEQLILIKGKRPVLQDLKMRPNISGKKTSGVLEAHQNGLRYISDKSEKIDITFRNIKHAFFQPCDGEMIILIHFFLESPIMLGKNKAQHIQFYTDAGILTEDLDNRRRNYDYDEDEAEQREKAKRKKLNQEFEGFCKAVEKQCNNQITFEVPYRQLGFFGSHHRANVFIAPTVNCLVSLTENPFFLVSIDEIEIIHFERVSFGLKNFDMVLIFKDYEKQPIRITAIPIEQYEIIKSWIDKVELIYTEQKINLNWNNILADIRADPEDFVSKGGWKQLVDDSDSEGGQQSQVDEDSEFTGEEDEDEEEASEDDDSEFDEDDEDESDFEEEELSEEGMSWDELSEEAERQDEEDEKRRRQNKGKPQPTNQRPPAKRR